MVMSSMSVTSPVSTNPGFFSSMSPETHEGLKFLGAFFGAVALLAGVTFFIILAANHWSLPSSGQTHASTAL